MTILILLVLIVFASNNKPDNIDWSKSLYSKHKIPYGLYAFKELNKDLFFNLELSRLSLSEIPEIEGNSNIIAIANGINVSSRDVSSIIERVEKGDNFILFGNTFTNKLLDTLGLGLSLEGKSENFVQDKIKAYSDFFINGTTKIRLNTELKSGGNYIIRREDVVEHFTIGLKTQADILALDNNDNPIVVRVKKGEGSIIFGTVPNFGSNVYLLKDNNSDFFASIFSLVDNSKPTLWTEFYQMGRGLSQSPFRYILSNPSLRWALFLMIGILMLFTIFEVKRKQRAIAIISPPSNDTLGFVDTISSLYFENRDNNTIALKRLQCFQSHIWELYYVQVDKMDSAAIKKLSNKSGVDLEIVQKIANYFLMDSGGNFSEGQLLVLSGLLDKYYKQERR